MSRKHCSSIGEPSDRDVPFLSNALHILFGLGWAADRSTPRWLSWLLISLVLFCLILAGAVWWHLLSALP